MCCVKDYDKLLLLNLRKLIYAWNYKTTFLEVAVLPYIGMYTKRMLKILLQTCS